MAVCTNFVDGVLTQLQTSVEECTGYILVTPTEYSSFFELFTLDPLLIASAFSFGMGAIVTVYLTAYPVSVVKRLILSYGERF